MTTLKTALREDMDIKGERAEYHILDYEEVLLNDDGVTWTKIPNMLLNLPVGFSISDGTLIKTGNSGVFLMNGVSDLEVDKACKIFYGLVVNGVVVDHEVTEHTFSNQAKIENISITALATINAGDTIEVWCKGDGTAGVTMKIAKLDVTFWG